MATAAAKKCVFPLDYAHNAGHVDNLYYYLWLKSPLTGSSCPNVRIPHTVVFNQGKPLWYFTSHDPTKGILRKRKEETTLEAIYKEFQRFPFKGNSRGGIVGYVITTEENNEGEPFTHVDFLDKEKLRAFLYGKLPQNGILQKFVPPKGFYNSTMRITWAPPRTFEVERRDSVHKMNEKRIKINDRGATHEGAQRSDMTAHMNRDHNVAQLKRMCQSMADHISVASPQQYVVTHMVLNCKQDLDDQYWLTYASSIDVESKLNMIALPTDLWTVALGLRMQNEGDKHDSSKAGAGRYLMTRKSDCMNCPLCEQSVVKEDMFEVSYKSVDAHHTRETAQALIDGVRLPLIPPAIFEVESDLTDEMYRQKLLDPSFLHRRISVCESCCLAVSESALHQMGKRPQPLLSDQQRITFRILQRAQLRTGSSESRFRQRRPHSVPAMGTAPDAQPGGGTPTPAARPVTAAFPARLKPTLSLTSLFQENTSLPPLQPDGDESNTRRPSSTGSELTGSLNRRSSELSHFSRTSSSVSMRGLLAASLLPSIPPVSTPPSSEPAPAPAAAPAPAPPPSNILVAAPGVAAMSAPAPAPPPASPAPSAVKGPPSPAASAPASPAKDKREPRRSSVAFVDAASPKRQTRAPVAPVVPHRRPSLSASLNISQTLGVVLPGEVPGDDLNASMPGRRGRRVSIVKLVDEHHREMPVRDPALFPPPNSHAI